MAILTPIGTLITYGPTLFVAAKSKFDATKDPRFEGNLIFSKAVQGTAEFKALKKYIADEAKVLFGDKLADKAFAARMKWPVKDYLKGEDGDLVLKAWTLNQPEVISANNETITVKGDVWSGQLARFEINAKAFDKSGSVGVSCFLNCVQITKAKMPRLDGRKPADKVFSKIEDEAGDSNAGDDEPF